jgi:hypothetical protein
VLYGPIVVMRNGPSGQPKNQLGLTGGSLAPPRPEGHWLRASGQARKLALSHYMSLSPAFALLCFFAASRFARGVEYTWIRSASTYALVLSLPCAFAGVALRQLIRCGVCGLHLPTSAEARIAGSRKWVWLASLGQCPGCGDDGSASPQSKAQWRQSGRRVEEAYWNSNRVLLAIAVVVLGWFAANYLMEFTASRAFPKPARSVPGAVPK